MDDDFTIPITTFENKDDNQPKRHELGWRAFAQRLCRYEERPTKDGRAWSPVTYVPGTTRGKANVEMVYALPLDIDHSTEGLPLDLLTGREYVAHTTHSHTPESPRWRVVLPLTRPVPGTEWPAFWLRANAFFGGCVDPQTKDSSRIFYLPSCPPGAVHETRVEHGALLNPDELPEVPTYEPPPIEQRNGHTSVLDRHLADWAQRFSVAKIDELASMAPKTGRNAACNRLAYLLGGLIADPIHELEVKWVADQLVDACHRNGLVAEDGVRSVRATIRSGLESGLTHAWSPADQGSPPPAKIGRNRKERRNGQAEPPATGLEAERMSDVENEPLDWLWRGRFARGKATLLMGDPGLGKSLITHWAAAQVSIGGEWPDGGKCDQGSAILFTIEDGLADTVKPRLVAAGADCSRIVAVRGVVGDDNNKAERMFALEEHLALLEELVMREQASLVVMDPVSAYLGPNINAHKESDVRRVLGPLQMMAERTNIVLLLVIHLTKGSGVAALYRATGSIAFPAACRIVLGVAPDPNDDDGKRRLLLPIKLNVGIPLSGIGYRIETTQQEILPRVDARDQPPILVWDKDPVLVDATVAMDRAGTQQEMGVLADCKRALAEIMSGGRILANEGFRQLKDAGASTAPATVARARKELGIRAVRDIRNGPWWWEKPTFPHIPTNGTTESTVSREPATPHFTDATGSVGSSDFKDFSRAREAPEFRYCPACAKNLTVQDYDEHLCPVHDGKCFAEHECDQL